MDTTPQRALGRTNLAVVAILLALVGCNIDYKVVEEPAAGDGMAGAGSGPAGGAGGSGDDGPPRSSIAGGSGGTGDAPAPLADVCRNSGTCSEIAVTNIDKVDLLFMIDNSASMREEQAALRVQFPNLIQVLTTGDREGDGTADFPPAKDLHLGVVSSDLGLVGIEGIELCGGLGDDGIMNDVPSGEVMNCQPTYPRFFSYTAGANDVNATATDLACVATLGTDGCGFEQQLESTLKALWPADDERVRFLADANGFGASGQGNATMGGPSGMNAGFQRSDSVQGLSVISLVLLTDEDDCSSSNTAHLTPNGFLDPNDPHQQALLAQGLNVRCHFNQQNLYPSNRYINAFKALRPGNEDLVQFSAIVGVPPEVVATVPADYADNEMARQSYYDGILNHPDMQPVVDTKETTDPSDDTMRSSCETPNGKAYPPHRIVEVAQGFGENGLVQSICQDDFGPAMDAIIARIADKLGAVCLPAMLERGPTGSVACDLIWALPPVGSAPSGTPTSCDQQPGFLLDLKAGRDARNDEGGALCRVAQLAVRSGAGGEPDFAPTETDGVVFADGWYYDDFSEDVQKECSRDPKARIAFTPNAKPPTGVRVFLDCAPDAQP